MGPRKKSKVSKNANTLTSRQPSAATVPLPASPESSTKHNKHLQELPEQSSTPSSSQADPLSIRTEPATIEPTISHLQDSERKSSSQSTKSWYGRTWPRVPKAAPVTQLAKDSISAVSEVATTARERTQQELTKPLKSPSLYLSRNLGSSTRSLPLSATTTKVNITSSPLNDTGQSRKGDSLDEETTPPNSGGLKVTKEEDEGNHKAIDEQKALMIEDKTRMDPAISNEDKHQEEVADRSSSWLAWFSKGETVNSQAPSNPPVAEEFSQTNSGKNILPEEASIKNVQSGEPHSDSDQRRNSDPNPLPIANLEGQQRRSWLGFWSRDDEKAAASLIKSSKPSTNFIPEGSTSDTKHEVRDVSQTTLSKAVNQDSVPSQSSGWAFWSRSTQNNLNENSAIADEGELAVAKSPSQSNPEAVVMDGSKGVIKASDKLGKSERSSSAGPPKGKKVSDVVTASSKSSSATSASIPSTTQLPKATNMLLKDNARNLLLPSLKQTYKAPESPGLLQQLGQLLSYTRAPVSKHVNLVRDPPCIKTALAIGVHGYFPAPLIRSVLGQPTGTSIKFAESAAGAIQKWTLDHGYSCEVEKVALEGEGKIEERIDLLWKLLLNWLDSIRKADFILVACHSQGVPVAMMLVAKLIAFGCVNSARIGVCAMAGVSLGPFADYKSRWISGSAGELFEFAQPDSKVSKDYEAALREALDFGVKVLYIGSIDDQLVSLEVRLSVTQPLDSTNVVAVFDFWGGQSSAYI